MGSHQDHCVSVISNTNIQRSGSISSNTNVKSLYQRRPNQDIYSHPTSSSLEESSVDETITPPPLPPIGRRNSAETATNPNERSESPPPGYEQKNGGSTRTHWSRKIIIPILLLNTVLMICIGAIAVTALYEIKELKRTDQVRARSISEHCVRLRVLELLVSDLKLFYTPRKELNATEVKDPEESKIDLENEIKTLQSEIKNLLEANKTCNDALSNIEIFPGQEEIKLLNNQVQNLLEANRTCYKALEEQYSAENCSSTRNEIEMLQLEITELRHANATCSKELKNIKDDIPPCLVVTTTISPEAIDIYNWVTAPNGLEYWISGGVNFFEANTTCIAKGAKMSVSGVRDPSTREFLVNNLISPRNVDVWIGLSDLDEEGLWMWQDGVLATAFNTNWGHRQPDNLYGNLVDCAWLDDSQLMHDASCYSSSRALCERELNSA